MVAMDFLTARTPMSRRSALARLGAATMVAGIGGARAGNLQEAVALGRTHAEVLRLLDESSRAGRRVRSLALYGTPSAPLYAMLTETPERPVAQRCHALLSAAELQSEIDRNAKEGFGLVFIAALGPAATARFTAVFEPQDKPPVTRLDLRPGAETAPDTFSGMVHQAKVKGLILRCAAPYGTASDPRYATIWIANHDDVAWDADGVSDDAPMFRERLAAQTAGRCRLQFVAATHEGRFLSVYRHDETGPWSAAEALDGQGLGRAIDANAANGLRPVVLQAAGATAASARFTAIFAAGETPVRRVFTATGPIAHPAIDEAMRTMMAGGMIRQAALAIVKGTRLVFARGYTFAEPDWPVTQPTTTFRIASVSKTVAALAIYHEIESGRLKLSDRVQDILALRTTTGGAPKDPRFNAITVEHLLAHTSGLSTHIMSSVAIRNAHRAAEPHRSWHFPVTAAMANAAVASSLLESAPGARFQYNNCAYYILGQIVAKLGGTATALETLDKRLFAPLGITRIRHARSRLADQPADEARYRVAYGRERTRILPLARSAMSDARELVPLGYGSEPMEIHEGDAGLSAAMTDLARLVAIMMVRGDSPVLRRATVRHLLANAVATRGHGFDGGRDLGDDTFYVFKLGALSASWNSVMIDGDIGLAVVWSDGKPAEGAHWYPNLPTVMNVARASSWGDDLFPQFGMASL